MCQRADARCRSARPVALTTDSSFVTACANDLGIDGVFARQVRALGRRGDVLFGISTSGESKNVPMAVAQPRVAQMAVVVLTGSDGRLAATADVAIRVPDESTAHLQENHLAIEHVICHIVERQLHHRM